MWAIRRGTRVLGALAAMSLGAAAPASADFHFACDGANAQTALAATGGDLAYKATVRCVGAQTVVVSPVTVENFLGTISFATYGTPGTSCSAALAGECDLVEVAGTIPMASPGQYRVSFSFGVTGPHGEAANLPRSGRWLWLTVGQPVRQCGATDSQQAC